MTTSHWENLEVFTITSATGTHNLYANGRQQAKLRITLQAIDINGQPVPMTQSELRSLQLIDAQGRLIETDPLDYAGSHTDALTLALQQYNPREYDLVAAGRVGFNPARHDRLQFNKYRRDFNGINWMWSRSHNPVYRFFPRAPGEREPQEEFGYVDEYIYTIDVYVRTISPKPLAIAAQLTRRDGQNVFSHRPQREKGVLTLQPVAPPNYAARDYTFSRIVISGNVESQQYFDTLDYYTFNLVSNQTDIEFLRFDMSPISIRRDALAPKDRGSISGFTYPGGDYFNFGMALRSLPTQIRSDFRRHGKVCICLARQTKFSPIPGGVNRDPVISRGPSTARALDMFGNDHQVRMQFQGNGRKYLELV